jgi:non-heme chloroperoxidase
MGAGEVARYLSRHGSARVARAALVGPITPFMMRTADNPDGQDPALRDLFAAAIEADYPRALRQFAPGFWGEGEEVSAEIKDWGHGLALQTSLVAAQMLLQANWATDFRPDLKAFDRPVLVLQGGTTNRRRSIDAGGRRRPRSPAPGSSSMRVGAMRFR